MGNRGRSTAARTFGTLAVISLLAFGGVCVGWVWSYARPKTKTYFGNPDFETAHWTTFRMGNGDLEWMFCHGTRHMQRGRRRIAWTIGWYGMSLSDYEEGGSGHRKIHIYFRDLAILTALLPGLWLVLDRRRAHPAREAAGLCTHCGYDLRASKDRCPECGTWIPKTTP